MKDEAEEVVLAYEGVSDARRSMLGSPAELEVGLWMDENGSNDEEVSTIGEGSRLG